MCVCVWHDPFYTLDTDLDSRLRLREGFSVPVVYIPVSLTLTVGEANNTQILKRQSACTLFFKCFVPGTKKKQKTGFGCCTGRSLVVDFLPAARPGAGGRPEAGMLRLGTPWLLVLTLWAARGHPHPAPQPQRDGNQVRDRDICQISQLKKWLKPAMSAIWLLRISLRFLT